MYSEKEIRMLLQKQLHDVHVQRVNEQQLDCMGCEMMLTVSQQKYLQVIDILTEQGSYARLMSLSILDIPVPVSAVRLKA